MAREFGSGWLVDCKFGTIGAASDKEGGIDMAKAKLEEWLEDYANGEYHLDIDDDGSDRIVVSGFCENEDDEDDFVGFNIYITKKDNIII